jgi:hypothetical protein
MELHQFKKYVETILKNTPFVLQKNTEPIDQSEEIPMD